ncbi:hypothetical protein TNCV_2965261 [Trichonephila clavipes]|nr:hypothetical protein TNCV_2965261 [Trichonephila clavipes]
MVPSSCLTSSSATENPPCRGAVMHVKSVKAFPLKWAGRKFGKWVFAQVSSSSPDYGSKSGGLPPIDLVLLPSVT